MESYIFRGHKKIQQGPDGEKPSLYPYHLWIGVLNDSLKLTGVSYVPTVSPVGLYVSSSI